MRSFSIVVAADQGRGIGKGPALPWRLPGDMAYFKRVTSEAPAGLRNAVIMGRKTYESVPAKFRPLPQRLNVVLSRGTPREAHDDVLFFASLDAALTALERRADIARVFVIGGGELYREALAHPACTRVYLTRVDATFDCDTFLAPFEAGFRLVTRDGPHDDHGVSYTFEVYERGA